MEAIFRALPFFICLHMISCAGGGSNTATDSGGTGATPTPTTTPTPTATPTPTPVASTILNGAVGGQTLQYGVATDPSDNVYIVGSTNADLDGETYSGGRDFYIVKYNSSGVRQWTVLDGQAGKLTEAYGVATDSAGNVFVTGYTTGQIDGQTHQCGSCDDIFITKYDTAGTWKWTVQKAAAGVAAYGITTDSSGNVIVVGRGSGMDGQAIHAGSGRDFFITKYDTTGTRVWTVGDGGSGTDISMAEAVVTDASDNIYVAGQTTGALDGESQTGSQDLFLTKYDANGSRGWTVQNGAATKTLGIHSIARSGTSLYVAGHTDGNINSQMLTGTQDLFLMKYNTSGTRAWTVLDGAASQSTTAYGVVADSSGNAYVSGVTQGGLDGLTLTGTNDFILVKYDSSGTRQWTAQDGVASVDTVSYSCTIDSSSHIYVAGETHGALDGKTLIGNWDYFLTQYSVSGTHL